jgi:hypothetical protein
MRLAPRARGKYKFTSGVRLGGVSERLGVGVMESSCMGQKGDGRLGETALPPGGGAIAAGAASNFTEANKGNEERLGGGASCRAQQAPLPGA